MKIILASKSGVRKKILDNNNVNCDVIVSNVDEDEVKESLLAEGADPLNISKNLAEIKSIKVSKKNPKCIISADRWISQKGFNNYGIIKFLANFFFQKLIKIFFKYKILDFTFAYRLYPKNALKGYKIKELRHGFALEILLSPMKRGFKVITLPAKWKKRVEGSSSITIDSYFSYLRVLFRNI